MAKIISKYSVGQTVYLIYNNIVKTATVQRILVESWQDRTYVIPLRVEITYEVGGFGKMPEDKLFQTKAQLLRTL